MRKLAELESKMGAPIAALAPKKLASHGFLYNAAIGLVSTMSEVVKVAGQNTKYAQSSPHKCAADGKVGNRVFTPHKPQKSPKLQAGNTMQLSPIQSLWDIQYEGPMATSPTLVTPLNLPKQNAENNPQVRK